MTPGEKERKKKINNVFKKAHLWDQLAILAQHEVEEVFEHEPIWSRHWRIRLGLTHGKWLNFIYLIGSCALIGGFAAQIWRTLSIKQADEFTIMLPILVAIGHFLHIPRAATSHFWVWWLSQSILAILAVILLVLFISYS